MHRLATRGGVQAVAEYRFTPSTWVNGALNLRLADIIKDKAILEAARKMAEALVEQDPELEAAENLQLKQYLMSLQGKTPWSRIS